MSFHNANSIAAAAAAQQQGQRVRIAVHNWQNATMQDLLNFVSRNARVGLSEPQVEGAVLMAYAPSRDQAMQVLKWNGANFAGNKLRFEIVGDPNAANNGSGGSTVEFLRQVLLSRYDPQARMLNLGSLAQDPMMVQKGMFNSPSTQARMFPALLKVASREPQLQSVQSVNLADNGLRDITTIGSLAQTFPDLRNLCLANNQIGRLNALEAWKNKFKHLRELLMTNNQVTGNSMYRSEMMRIFPKLAILDNVMVRDAQRLDAIFTFPLKLQQFHFDNDQLAQTSTQFVTNFLNCWDSPDRCAQLLPLYTPQSQFSVCADTSVPPSTARDADQNPAFGFYVPHSRNINKVSSEKTLEQRLATGQEQIATAFRQLPASRHALQQDPQGYAMQTIEYPQVNGFMVVLHGYFEETAKPELEQQSGSSGNKYNNRGRRNNNSHSNNPASNRLSKKSFDRTWVVVPMNGSFIIASDILVVRTYTGNTWSEPAPVPVPTPVAAPVTGGIAPGGIAPGAIAPVPGANVPIAAAIPAGALPPTLQLPPDVAARLTPVQLDLLTKLHLQTKLNAEYTYMLAEQSGWNYDNAVKGFQASVGNLPPNAFVQ